MKAIPDKPLVACERAILRAAIIETNREAP